MTDTAFGNHQPQDDRPKARGSFFTSPGGILTIVGILAAVILGLWWFVFGPQSALSHGNKAEANLNKAYSNGANYLNDCVVRSAQSAQVAGANAAAVQATLRSAVSGIKSDGPAATLDTTTPQGRSGLYAMLVQSWPELKGQTDQFAKVMDVINGCRTDYRNMQSKVINDANDFKGWYTGSWTARQFAAGQFPNDNLEILVPGAPHLTGQAALDRMREPIVGQSTSDSYRDGIDRTQTDLPFGPAVPTPSK